MTTPLKTVIYTTICVVVVLGSPFEQSFSILPHTPSGTIVTHRQFLWCYNHSQTLPVELQSLAETPSYISHSHTPSGTRVTHRHSLWYYCHLQTLPVVLQSLRDTPCGTRVRQSNTSYGTSHSQANPVVLVIHGHFLWYYSH